MDHRREAITDALDVLGLLLVAGGVGAALYPLIGWWCVAVAGVVVLAGAQLGAWVEQRQQPPPSSEVDDV